MKKFLTKNYKSILSAVILLCVLALPIAVGASDLSTQINQNLTNTRLADSLGGKLSLPETIGRVIMAALALLGVVFVILTIYAGFKWMIANGDPAKVDKAKAMLVQSVIGLAIMLISYGIATFVIDAIMNSAGSAS